MPLTGELFLKMLALISDIHSNLEALQAVMDDIGSQGIKKVYCLGDIIGYGPNPAECISVVRARCEMTLCGNHDAATITGLPFGFNQIAKDAIFWTRRKLEPKFYSLSKKQLRWQFLKNLPNRHEDDEGRRLFVHASPRDPISEYLVESDCEDVGFGTSGKVEANLELIKGAVFIGHTHRPGIITEDVRFLHLEEFDGEFELEDGKKYIVNIGSVGQPRDNDSRACYVILDENKVKYRRIQYDIEKTAQKILNIKDLDARNAERLREGK